MKGRPTFIVVLTRKGGPFQEIWAKHQVANAQYGRGEHAKKNPNTGESVAGPVTLSEEKFRHGSRGTGGMTHDDRDRRPPDVFGGKVTLHAGGDRPADLVPPIVPGEGAK